MAVIRWRRSLSFGFWNGNDAFRSDQFGWAAYERNKVSEPHAH